MAEDTAIHRAIKESLPADPVRHEIEIFIVPRVYLIHPLTGGKIEISVRPAPKAVGHEDE